MPQNADHLSREEADEVEERHLLRPPVVYEVVSQQGEEELARPFPSLWWSGVAAGVSLSFSVLAEAILIEHLPDANWRPLVADFGYCVGFVLVIMARQQLFTESTLTAVLPVVREPRFAKIRAMVRLWSIVLTANVAGALIAAAFCSVPGVLEPEILHGMVETSREAMSLAWLEMLYSGTSAGFLMAALVWILPSAEETRLHVIILISYLIALGGFSHIVAGSVEGFLLVLDGDYGIGQMLFGFAIPTLIGNILGGTVLFAVIAYAQVHKEI